MYSKMVLRILTISVALIISALLVPSTVRAELAAETTLNFEKAVLNEPNEMPLMLANNNSDAEITLYLLPSGDNGTCSVDVLVPEATPTPNPQLTIPAEETVDIIVIYQTSTTELCSGEILIYWFGGGGSGWHTITVDGIGEEANHNIFIGSLDTGILDREWQDRYISEWIEECAADARNHRDFVKKIFRLTKKMKRDDAITWKEMRIIRRYARRANIPTIGIEVSDQGTIVIGGRDTKVEDRSYDGYLLSEWLKECADEAGSHGGFVSCVSQLTNKIKKEGLMSRKDKRRIRRNVAKAKLYGRRCVK
ncbi:MAG: hypothetical protein PVH82_08700 [Desulfobacteraceae bacterium]|jgi:hypothetical protein